MPKPEIHLIFLKKKVFLFFYAIKTYPIRAFLCALPALPSSPPHLASEGPEVVQPSVSSTWGDAGKPYAPLLHCPLPTNCTEERATSEDTYLNKVQKLYFYMELYLVC